MVYYNMSAHVSISTPFPNPITLVVDSRAERVTWLEQGSRREASARCLQPLADVIIKMSDIHLRKCYTNPGPMQSVAFS